MIACYCRVSTDEQARDGISLEEQQNRLKAYCVSQGWDKYKIYIDDGYSAKNTKRPQLQQLLTDIKNGKITKVLVTKTDRFSRKLLDMADMLNLFEQYNIDFCSASESFDTSTPAGRMMLNLLISFAQFERERISERVTDNMTYNAQNGRLQQPPCFGYDIVKDEVSEDKIFIPNKEESKWALQIFKWFTEDNFGYLRIAKRLNELGIKTKKNGQWSVHGVKVFLKNPLLTGRLVWNRRDCKGDKIKFRDESEWIIIEDSHKAIIPLDLWEKAQYKINNNIKRGTPKSKNLLKGLIKCGHCGSSMVSGGKQNTPIYLCSKYRQGSGCKRNKVSIEEIDDNILNTVIKRLSQVDISNDSIPEENISVNKKSLNQQLEKIKQKMDFQLQLLENGDIDREEFKFARERISKEKNQIQNKLEMVKTTSISKTISLSKEILPILQSEKYTKIQKRKQLEKIINKIIVYECGNEINIIYKDLI